MSAATPVNQAAVEPAATETGSAPAARRIAGQVVEHVAAGRPSADPAAVPSSAVGIVNVANGLTLLRVALVPVFAAALAVDSGRSTGWRVIAWAVFAVASLTDRLDGEVARRYHLVTDFGKIADPIADKALTGTALIGLSVLGQLSWWVTIVVMARELGVTALRFWVIRHGVIPASRGGKLKTLLQGIAITGYLLPLTGVATVVRAPLMALAVGVTVLTGLDYVVQAVRLRRAARATR